MPETFCRGGGERRSGWKVDVLDAGMRDSSIGVTGKRYCVKGCFCFNYYIIS